jgi:hypothetical protein
MRKLLWVFLLAFVKEIKKLVQKLVNTILLNLRNP